jgi:AcrR family transcriptional regulator
VDEVATECGVSKHTIYRRYPSKLSLVDAVVRRDLAKFQADVSAATQWADPVSALRESAKQLFAHRLVPEHAAFATFLLAEATYSPEMRQKLKNWTSLSAEPMLDLIAAAQAAGRMDPGPPLAAFRLLIDLMDGYSRYVRMDEPDLFSGYAPDTFFEERWRIFRLACNVS